MEDEDAIGRWYAVADSGAGAAGAVAARAALLVQRHRLTQIDVQLLSDEPWPAAVADAVVAGRRLTRRRGTIARIDPRDDGELAVAVALAPYTISATALGEAARGVHVVWDVGDTGTSVSFRLTAAELVGVRAAIAEAGGRPDALVALS